MPDALKLMGIFAHPDDESLGNGGTFARYAAEGVETSVVTATRGEHGWFGPESDYPGPAELGRTREAELKAAAEKLAIAEVSFLDYEDGLLDQADSSEVIAKIVAHVRRVRPQVAITFDPQGAYGHPDHMAICQLATSALVAAADSRYDGLGDPHTVSKLYYMAFDRESWKTYESAFGDLVMTVDGEDRRAQVWEDWAITTAIDTAAYWRTAWDAIRCHRTQLHSYQALLDLPAADHEKLWGTHHYYRAYSLVGRRGRETERDLFEGLR